MRAERRGGGGRMSEELGERIEIGERVKRVSVKGREGGGGTYHARVLA